MKKFKYVKSLSVYLEMLRVKQWVKNILLVVPLFTSQNIEDTNYFDILLLSFLAFCLCSSSVYIINDIIDIKNDRKHPIKKYRPFAFGLVPISVGIIITPLLLAFSFLIAFFVNIKFLIALFIYFLLSFLYSLKIKKIINIDCITLAFLYTIRVIAGGLAVDVAISFWLLAFSFFIFTSLAYLKRFVELKLIDEKNIAGRGYTKDDIDIVRTIGICTGLLSSVILSLYANDENIKNQYLEPKYIWITIPILIIWVNNLWTNANRGNIKYDPLEYAIKNKFSLFNGFLFITCFILAIKGTPN